MKLKLRAHTPDFNVKLEDMFDLDKKVKTNVANRAMMMFRAKVDTPLKKNDMLIKGTKVLTL